MARAFQVSWWGWLQLGARLLKAAGTDGVAGVPRRLGIGLAVWLACGALNLSHWTGFLADELLFRGYRRVDASSPLFIVGLPRSGTTFLHRLLARDERFTAVTTLESVLAPSVTERYLWRGMLRLLEPFGPLRAPRWLRDRMDHIHRIRLREPEEDFLLLLPVQACFLMVLLCPGSRHYWNLARFDRRMSAGYARTVARFYRRCLQRHLYFHGGGRRVLSKNPSFTPMMETLRAQFPGADFIACVREPEAVVPSQLSALLPAFRLLGRRGGPPPGFQRRIITMLHEYYATLLAGAERRALLVVDMQSLTDSLEATVDRILSKTLGQSPGQPPAAGLAAELAALGAARGAHDSRHRYALEDFGLDAARVRRRFAEVWEPLAAHAQSTAA